MNFIEYLKNIKNQLLNIQEPVEKDEVKETPQVPEIVIENHHSLFTGEEEIITKGAQMMLDEKRVDNLEEGIIVFATLIRGLKYKRTDIDEEGNKKIILADITLEDTPTKSL